MRWGVVSADQTSSVMNGPPTVDQVVTPAGEVTFGPGLRLPDAVPWRRQGGRSVANLTGADMERMSVLDATFLHVEDGITHMHIGSMARFEGPMPPFAAMSELVERKLPRLSRYRQRVRFVPGGLGRPVWVDDPHFNLRYHLRHTALPNPGDAQAVRNLMGRLMSQPLDRHRPLWEA